MDEDAAQALAYQCELENRRYEEESLNSDKLESDYVSESGKKKS